MAPLRTLLLAVLMAATVGIRAQHTFRFHDGKFRIAQFTDIHWDERSPQCGKTVAAIRAVIDSEKPDLAILTGDIVTAQPAREGWQSVIRIFEEARLPFVVTMGNHDAQELSKDSIYLLLTASGYYAGQRGPANIFGYGNCTLPVYGADATNGKPEAVLYCIDSNDYQPVKEYGEYDWIHFDEIEWYRHESERYTAGNGGRPLPALAFFHIPLLEYNHVVADDDYLGAYGDHEVASAMINSGFFASLIEKGDVMATFCGHDHENDFIGMERGIALAYGRCSGYDAYGDAVRGGRIIDLYEGKRKFDTWNATPLGREDAFYYPSAITSKDEREMIYLPARSVQPTRQGVRYAYYEGTCKRTADIEKMERKGEGVLPNFSIEGARQPDHFGFVYRTYLKIDRRGVYRFYTYSDDGTQLLIDGQVVVDNDGGHSARRREGKVALEAGFHEVELRYFEDYMGQTLEVGYASKDIEETLLPAHLLYVDGKEAKSAKRRNNFTRK